jgi:acyl-coenzyme A thioesterase PaaI-like protein
LAITLPRADPLAVERPSSARRLALRMLSLYPPFLGAGIRVRRLAGDPPGYETRLRLRFWNRNYHGTHFGGAIYTLCDPFYVLILAAELGSGYAVWDKSATIHFRRPGRGTLHARFEIPRAKVELIRVAADAGERLEPVFVAEVRNDEDEVVAEVEKVLSVRRRDRDRERLEATSKG